MIIMRPCTTLNVPQGLSPIPGFMTIAMMVLDPVAVSNGILSEEINPSKAPAEDEEIDPGTGVPRAILKTAIATVDLGILPLHQTADDRLWTPDADSLNDTGLRILQAISCSYIAQGTKFNGDQILPIALVVSVNRPRLAPEAKYSVN